MFSKVTNFFKVFNFGIIKKIYWINYSVLHMKPGGDPTLSTDLISDK